jgi:hypothetical protein
MRRLVNERQAVADKQPREKGVTGTDLLREYGCGDLNDELGKTISRVIVAIREDAQARGKDSSSKGSITLKLNFKGECLNSGAVGMGVEYDLNFKEPKPVRSKEVFFIKGDRLVRENPAQGKLDFERELEKGN